ncbi:hypothetical protein LTR12_000086 [Friedmanniomyces endolithicus]|nr:hypothetical protein LTR12_000086 [Friedmanniomyces endolithicus]
MHNAEASASREAGATSDTPPTSNSTAPSTSSSSADTVQANIERRRVQCQSSDDDRTTWIPIQAWLVERKVSYGAHPAPGTLAQREFQIALAPGTPLGIVVDGNRDDIADYGATKSQSKANDIHGHVSKLLSAGSDAQADFMVEVFDTDRITCSFSEPHLRALRSVGALERGRGCPENTGSTQRPVPTIVVSISDQHEPVDMDGALAHLEAIVDGLKGDMPVVQIRFLAMD